MIRVRSVIQSEGYTVGYTNTFNRHNHFTIIWIGQINCFSIKVGNHNLTTQTTNAESCFVHIIYVVLGNTILYLHVSEI